MDPRKQRGSRSFVLEEALEPLLTLFEQNLGDTQNATQIKAWIQHSYRSAPNLAEATLRLVHELFADYGLVILDADQRALKENFIPLHQK